MFNVWLKDSDAAIIEWSLKRISSPFKLIVIVNNKPVSVLNLNNTASYHLLENLKPLTNYSLCLQANEEHLCRNITTKSQQYISISSSSSSSSSSTASASITLNIEYLIIGLSFGMISILLVLFIIILFIIKQRKKYPHSLKARTMESYYQTNSSDTTHIATCNNSIEENSIKSLNRPQSTPIFCYCQLPSSYCHDQQTYHYYHEIPFYKPPVII